MATPHTNEKWLDDQHSLRPILESIIHESISVDQFLAELWLEGYKIVALEEQDDERSH